MQDYRSGTLLSGQLKALSIKALQDEVKAFQEVRAGRSLVVAPADRPCRTAKSRHHRRAASVIHGSQAKDRSQAELGQHQLVVSDFGTVCNRVYSCIIGFQSHTDRFPRDTSASLLQCLHVVWQPYDWRLYSIHIGSAILIQYFCLLTTGDQARRSPNAVSYCDRSSLNINCDVTSTTFSPCRAKVNLHWSLLDATLPRLSLLAPP